MNLGFVSLKSFLKRRKTRIRPEIHIKRKGFLKKKKKKLKVQINNQFNKNRDRQCGESTGKLLRFGMRKERQA